MPIYEHMLRYAPDDVIFLTNDVRSLFLRSNLFVSPTLLFFFYLILCYMLPDECLSFSLEHCTNVIYFFLFLGTEPTASHMLGKHSIKELYAEPLLLL